MVGRAENEAFGAAKNRSGSTGHLSRVATGAQVKKS